MDTTQWKRCLSMCLYCIHAIPLTSVFLHIAILLRVYGKSVEIILNIAFDWIIAINILC